MQLLLVICAFHFKECDLVIHLRMRDAANVFIIRQISYTLLDLKQHLGH